MSFAPDSPPFAKSEALLRVPVGFASPLWGLFAGAAVSGAAWWWMTRWTRPQNLEALFAGIAETQGAGETHVEALAPPAIEAPAVEALIGSLPEPVAEMVEAAAEPSQALATVVEPPVTAEPSVEVAGPDASVEAVEAPKVRKATPPKSA